MMFFDNIVPSVITVLSSLITLSIIFALVSYFIYFPVKKTINDRQDFIKNNINESIEKNRKADEFIEESERNIKASLSDSKHILENARVEANKIRQEIITNTEKEIETLKQQLKEKSDKQIQKLELDFNEKVVEVSLEISKKVIKDKVSINEEKELVDSFIEELQKYEHNK